ncbi:MAG: S8 family peptidase [Acidobacteriia bacterium]|nr:S8 family peptidase [Terriglobia bacterium]
MRHRHPILWLFMVVALSLPMVCLGGGLDKLDESLRDRVRRGDRGTVPIIIRTAPLPDDSTRSKSRLNQALYDRLEGHGGRVKKEFWVITGLAAEVEIRGLDELAQIPGIEGISEDHVVRPSNDITVKAVGADIARMEYGVEGNGIGIAVLDSGVSPHGRDLDGSPRTGSRILVQWSTVGSTGNALANAGSMDDSYGHGTHVAGIIAGSGGESDGALSGIAPKAKVISVKVLGDDGSGYVSDVIEGIQWVIQNRFKYNIRIINLSLGHPVTESYKTDPLAQACEAAVRAGIVVVVAAGNYGKDEFGKIVYGGITSPGHDPQVITVGATKSQGTPFRSDDAIADYSSRGPTAFDLLSKPDLVAAGNRVKSIADPSPNMNDLFDLFPQNRVDPSYYSSPGGTEIKKVHYFTLSGTSMATAVVSGTVALMLQAHPDLTPNLVKAILMVTAQDLRLPFVVQGAGYLNTYGAVMLAQNLTSTRTPMGSSQLIDNGKALSTQNSIQGETVNWGGNIIWGENLLWGGIIENNLAIWSNQVAWGSGNVLWSNGNALWSSGNVLWGSSNVLWSSGNVLWGSSVIWGGNIATGGSYIGAGAAQSLNPVLMSSSLWSPDFQGGMPIAASSNVLWSNSNVLWSSSFSIQGED